MTRREVPALVAALAYAALGWHVLPLYGIVDGRCGCGRADCERNAGKHPVGTLVPNGLTDATTDAAVIRDWFRRVPTANVGVRTGRVSGIVVVDVDGPGGALTWDMLAGEHGRVETVEAHTGGGGRHLVFAYPELPPQRHLHTGTNTLGPRVDSRGDGGYVVVEPSAHRSGRAYVWEASSSPLDGVAPAALPEWIRRKLERGSPGTVVRPRSAPADATPLAPERVAELRSALDVIPSDERDVWLRVGMALHAEHPGQEGFDLWTAWSQTSPKFDAADQRRTWEHFRRPEERGDAITGATLFALARDYGWDSDGDFVNPSVREFAGRLVGGLATAPAPVAARARPAAREKPAFPAHLLDVPGLVGEIAGYINDSARYPQPVLALAAGIAATATFTGRKVRTESDLRTNIYVLAVAEAGAGKEHARQALRTLFSEVGAFPRVAVEGLASDAALATALLASPSSLFLLDEIGRFLAVVTAERAAAHLSEIVTQLLRLYSVAAGPYCPKVYADADRNQTIEQPCLSIYGTTVPGRLLESLTTSQLEDGFLSRLLVFESEDPDPEPRDVPMALPPAGLVERCQRWERTPEAATPRGNLDALRPSPRIVSPEPDARAALAAFERSMREKRHELRERGESAGLYTRTAAGAYKLALIRAAGRAAAPDDLTAPITITPDDAAWGCELALHLADAMAWRITSHVAENTTERNVKRVATIVRDAGPGGITRAELTRRTQFLRQGDRDDVIKTLTQSGQVIVLRDADARGRPAERFCWASWLETSSPSVEGNTNGKH